jgi:hypothetical protein
MPNIDPEEVRIGDFSKPVVPPKKSAQASPTAEKLTEAEDILKKEADEAEKSLKPMASYEDRLKEIGVTREQAAFIVDEVLLKGCYSEEIHLTSRISVRFRTRLYRDTQRMQSYLEVSRPSYEAHYNEIIFKYSLASSLEKFGGDKFDHPNRKASGEEIEKSFQTRLTFVENLPDVTLRLLYTKLGKFDGKVRICLEEGAIENF